MEHLQPIQKQFQKKFPYVYEWQDAVNYQYRRHFHKGRSSLYIIEGQVEMFFENGETKLLKQGDIFDVPQHVFHTAQVGPKGCKYIVGQEFKEDENF